MNRKILFYFVLSMTVVFGFLLRIYNLNWDSSFHMHPDERAIVLFTLPLIFPHSVSEFLSAQSTWNPHFFAYGSFPIYLLKIVSLFAGIFSKDYLFYDKINLLGRGISAIFDTVTIFLVFALAKNIFSKKVGLLAAFFYAISVLPIQTSHFYAVDTMLNCFIVATLFFLVRLYRHPSLRAALPVGLFFGLALATKISAIAVSIPIVFTITVDFLLVFLKRPHKVIVGSPHLRPLLRKLFIESATIFSTATIVFIICEPYALIDSQNFYLQNLQQFAMTHNAFTFPYTLQYVGKIPYIYDIKNIFLWGQGPLLALFSFVGVLFVTYAAMRKAISGKLAQEVIILVFLWSYFIIVGKFAIGFMRYMLPLYPLLAIFAANLVYTIGIWLRRTSIRTVYYLLLIIILLVWPFSFLAIYNFPNTRVQATNWILEHIPPGKTLAIEHWDDGLPLTNGQNYTSQTLELYNPETPEKWQKINKQLQQTDAIIIASNRLYVPLQKLTDCANLPPLQCHKESAIYYHRLFSGSLGFKKIAEFSVYPTIPFTNIHINDENADESFTVYDHPKVMIFTKSP